MYRWCITWWSYCYCFNLKYICTRWFFKCLSIPEIWYVWNTPSEPLLIPPPDFVCTAISFAVSFCRDKSSILLIRYVGNTPSEPLLVPPLDFIFTCNPLLMLSDSSVYIQNTYTYKKREGKGKKSILNHVRRPRPWNPKAVSPGPRAPPWPRPAAPAPRLHSAAPERQHVRARTTAWQLRGGGVPAAAAFASAPACRRRSAFSRSPSCTCAMSGVSPENGSLRSSAAAPVPVTRRRSKQSCVWTRLHKLTSALLLSPVYRHTCSMLDASAVTSPSPTRTHAAHAHHQGPISSSSSSMKRWEKRSSHALHHFHRGHLFSASICDPHASRRAQK